MKTLRLLHGTILIKLKWYNANYILSREWILCGKRQGRAISISNAFFRDVNIDMHRPLASEDTKYVIPFQPWHIGHPAIWGDINQPNIQLLICICTLHRPDLHRSLESPMPFTPSYSSLTLLSQEESWRKRNEKYGLNVNITFHA